MINFIGNRRIEWGYCQGCMTQTKLTLWKTIYGVDHFHCDFGHLVVVTNSQKEAKREQQNSQLS